MLQKGKKKHEFDQTTSSGYKFPGGCVVVNGKGATKCHCHGVDELS